MDDDDLGCVTIGRRVGLRAADRPGTSTLGVARIPAADIVNHPA